MSDLESYEVTGLETTNHEQHAPTRYVARALENAILLIESDAQRHSTLQSALQACGFSVRAVNLIAEVARWPVGQVVITDQQRFTPWWKEVGAAHVIVLADSSEEGLMAVVRGASSWLPRDCSGDALVAAVQRLATPVADSQTA
jgi:hypothetical protein